MKTPKNEKEIGELLYRTLHRKSHGRAWAVLAIVIAILVISLYFTNNPQYVCNTC